jgi:hypothetical protein
MALALVALVAAVWGGLVRLGLTLPQPPAAAVAFHGPLMVGGFLGTLIALERAVALGHPAGYAGPLATGLGALALIAGVSAPVGMALMAAGSAAMLGIFVVLLRRQATLFTAVMTLGALAWLVAQGLWATGWPVYRLALWWAGFLVLTIAGERLELSRLVRVSPVGRAAFLVAVTILGIGLVIGLAAPGAGARVTGTGCLALAAWLARHDVARRTVRQPGLTRFIALCLLSGYVWLAVGGVLAIAYGGVAAGPGYDAILHALFLGFVFAMIFGHAPIIFPAVLGVPVGFRPAFYGHLAVLHASVALRVAGDVTGWMPGREWGGALNALALGLFLASTLTSVLRPAGRPAPDHDR